MNRDFIDMLSALCEAGVDFPIDVNIEALAVPVLGRDDFIKNKKATGRPRDLSDLTLLPPA